MSCISSRCTQPSAALKPAIFYIVGRSHSISHISQVGFWPDEAIEWYLTRRRRKVRDKRTGVFYQWPPQEVVAQARQIGFNVIPMGFLEPKKQA